MTASPAGDGMALATACRRIVAAALRERGALATVLGIKRVDLDTLQLIADHEDVSPGQLTDWLVMSTGGVNAVLDRLIAAGLVTRARVPRGRRRVTLEPSDAGRKVIADQLEGLAQTIVDLSPTTTTEDEALADAVEGLARAAEARAGALTGAAADHAQASARQDMRPAAAVRWG